MLPRADRVWVDPEKPREHNLAHAQEVAHPAHIPQARGRYVAVAGQEAFIADNAEEAWSWAEKAHPEDDGALCQYIFPHTGPRFYGHRRRMADV